MNLLLVTNDFPPRSGGIQQYCHNLVRRLPPDRVVVYAPAWPGAAAFDAAQPFRVVRHPGRTMLPTPDVLRRTVALAREVRPDLICFGAAFPLGLLAGRLTRATGVPCLGFTHGVEVAVGRVPLARRLLLRVAGDLRLLTAVSHWSAARVGKAVRPLPGRAARESTPAPTTRRSTGGSARAPPAGVGAGLACRVRLVPRKGQDRQSRPGRGGCGCRRRGCRWSGVRRRPAAAPAEAAAAVADRITWPARWPGRDLPAHYAAGDVFAMHIPDPLAGAGLPGGPGRCS